MGSEAVARAFADIRAALAVLNAEVDGCGSEPFSAADPLAGLADGSLDILAGAKEAEAGLAGLKARAAMKYADTAHALAPDMPVQAQEMAVAAEIGSVLALGPRAAGAFLAASHALDKTLPLTLSALQAGSISWQHALALVDEAATLDPAGAAALEAHFLDPATPRPATRQRSGKYPRTGFESRPAPGANATTPGASRSATPRPWRTGASNAGRTRTAWPGSRPASPPTRHWQAGTASTPSPGPPKDRRAPHPDPDPGRRIRLSNPHQRHQYKLPCRQR